MALDDTGNSDYRHLHSPGAVIDANNGRYQTFQQDSISGLRPGSRVRIDNGRLYPY